MILLLSNEVRTSGMEHDKNLDRFHEFREIQLTLACHDSLLKWFRGYGDPLILLGCNNKRSSD
jgi:hypothetical protein